MNLLSYMARCQSLKYLSGSRNPPELQREVLERRRMEIRRIRRYRIRDNRRPVPVVKRLPCRLLDADLRNGAGDNQRLDAQRTQDILQVGVTEGAVAVLFDDIIVARRIDLVDDIGAVEFLANVSIEPPICPLARPNRRLKLW